MTAALVIYDYIITVQAEITLVWRTPGITPWKVVFLLIRYAVLVKAILLTASLWTVDVLVSF